LGYIAFGLSPTADTKLEFDTSKAADNLSLAIAHQMGRSWSNGEPDPVREQYVRELAARRAKNEQTSKT
jgi:hypothetical protein